MTMRHRFISWLATAATVFCLLGSSVSVSAQTVRPPLTNDDVIQMVKASLSEDLILAQLRASRTAFDLSVAEVIRLSTAGVSDTLIAAMRKPATAAEPIRATPSAAPAPKAPASPVMASAQTTAPNKGFVDLNFVGVQSSQGEQLVTFNTVLFREPLAAAALYPALPRVKGIDVGGGFRWPFGRQPIFGLGVHFDFVDYTMLAGLGVTIPHPLQFGRTATATSISSLMNRKDRNIDIMAMAFVPTSAAWSVRVFGGPTHFRVEEERVRIINYNQVFSVFGANVVTITTAPLATAEGSRWGFNAGVDVGYFFSRYVGIGGMLRASKGTVTLTDPLTNDAVERKAGHLAYGAGLRFRF